MAKLKNTNKNQDGEKSRRTGRESPRPWIDATAFGSITINGQKIEHDVILRLDGSIEKRKKKLSKKVYGTSHIVSLEEAKYVYERGAELLVIGTGHSGLLELSEEAERYFKKQGCKVKTKNTTKAIHLWNSSGENVIGLIHITC